MSDAYSDKVHGVALSLLAFIENNTKIGTC